jgi:hypothetical protein
MADETRLSLKTYRVCSYSSLSLAFAPALYFVLRLFGTLGGRLGLNEMFELVIECSLVECTAAVVAGNCVGRLKEARNQRRLASAVVRPYLWGSRLAFWFSIMTLLWTPFALVFLIALGIGVGG